MCAQRNLEVAAETEVIADPPLQVQRLFRSQRLHRLPDGNENDNQSTRNICVIIRKDTSITT